MIESVSPQGSRLRSAVAAAATGAVTLANMIDLKSFAGG